MKLIAESSNNSSNSNFDKKSDTSSTSSKELSNTSKLENLDEDSKRKFRLNQNRISAMKCRQKKKQQFQDLMEKKNALEDSNLELKEKFENIKKQFKETQEENEDLKKRLDFMEKQQEILFRIVSETKGNYQQGLYSLSSIATLSSGQTDPLLKLTVEQKFGSSNMSAFTPSRSPSIGVQRPIAQMLQAQNQIQNSSKGISIDMHPENTLTLAQVLSEIFKNNVCKQL